MTFRVVVSPQARRALESELGHRVAVAAWEFIRGPLADNPRRVGKPLGGHLEGLWSARRGQYRVVYRVDDEIVTVVVLRVAHRGVAYR